MPTQLALGYLLNPNESPAGTSPCVALAYWKYMKVEMSIKQISKGYRLARGLAFSFYLLFYINQLFEQVLPIEAAVYKQEA